MPSLSRFKRNLEINSTMCAQGPDAFGFLRAWYGARVKSRLSFLMPEEILVKLRVNGRLLNLPVRLNTDDAVVIAGVYADKEYESSLIDGPVTRILDLGTNAGFAMAYFSAVYEDAEFIAVEPDPRNLSQIAKTLDKNFNICATVVSGAVSGESGLLSFSRDPNNPSCSRISQEGDVNTLKVSTFTLKELLALKSWDWVDIIKMDIEGVEEDLVNHAMPELQKARYIVFELHPWVDEDGVLSKLEEGGFEIVQINADGEQTYLAINQNFNV